MSDHGDTKLAAADDSEMIKNLDLLMNLDLFEDPELSEMVDQLEDLEKDSDEEGGK